MRQGIEQTSWKALKAGPFMDRVGPVLKARSPEGQSIYALRADASHCNAIGMVHGGVITSLLDQAMAVEAWNAADRRPVVTLQMDTRFIGTARADEHLTASATLRHATLSTLFADAEVHSGERLIATATAVMKIVARKDKP